MTRLRIGELHRFRGGDRPFAYLVPSGAVFALDGAAEAILDALEEGASTRGDLAARLAGRFSPEIVDATLSELAAARAVRAEDAPAEPVEPKVRQLPDLPFPLTTLVLNVANRCNLACAYCYEYGEDRIPSTAAGPTLMSEETARDSVDFMLREARSRRVAHLTFFGGETLLNFPLLRSTIDYARARAAEEGKEVDFSLTTNATLLSEEAIDFLASNRVGVTVSIDGPRAAHDSFRVFHDGTGSYDVVAPRIRELLRRHRTRPIGARVTLTSRSNDVLGIFRHLTDEMGFWEVGFAPVTASGGRGHALAADGLDRVLEGFETLAFEFLEAAASGRHHGFSNVRDTLEEIHRGCSKAYPCGAGLGLLGVSTSGDVALCHRFASSGSHTLGNVRDGVDRLVQLEFLERNHIDEKTDCRRCWARPLCSGGCYHEAYTRYGATTHPNLHFCDWIRRWTHTCLEVYGALSERNPDFFRRLDEDAGSA